MTSVSIVIPAFNQAHFLGAAIKSCLDQTHSCEVVVIDDGSTDNTPEIAAQFSQRIKYIRQTNAGLPGARNRGLAESSGTYVCFLDSDDFYHPEKIRKQVELLEQNPDLGFVYCDATTVDVDGKPHPDQTSISDLSRVLSGDIFPALMMGGYFPPHTVMIRRSILAEVGPFDPTLGGHADYELWLRVAGAGHRALYHPDKYAYYRTYANSMSKDGQHMLESRQQSLKKIATLFPERVGLAASDLQQAVQDSFFSLQWLNKNWENVVSSKGVSSPNATGEEELYSLLRNLSKGRMLRGAIDQTAIWPVTIDSVTADAMLLHPSAEMTFQIPTGAAGHFRASVALHPDVWSKASSCEFSVRVDGRVAFAFAIDPVRIPTDRRWHQVDLQIPESSAGRHDLILQTKGIPNNEFCWAMWRNPHFAWKTQKAIPLVIAV
jgi:glycosyltransferase involved in cell wall biosynthesis